MKCIISTKTQICGYRRHGTHRKIDSKITNRFAKYIIENPLRAEEVTKLMNEILVEQPKEEFNKNISNFRIYDLGFTNFSRK